MFPYGRVLKNINFGAIGLYHKTFATLSKRMGLVVDIDRVIADALPYYTSIGWTWKIVEPMPDGSNHYVLTTRIGLTQTQKADVRSAIDVCGLIPGGSTIEFQIEPEPL